MDGHVDIEAQRHNEQDTSTSAHGQINANHLHSSFFRVRINIFTILPL